MKSWYLRIYLRQVSNALAANTLRGGIRTVQAICFIAFHLTKINLELVVFVFTILIVTLVGLGLGAFLRLLLLANGLGGIE